MYNFPARNSSNFHEVLSYCVKKTTLLNVNVVFPIRSSIWFQTLLRGGALPSAPGVLGDEKWLSQNVLFCWHGITLRMWRQGKLFLHCCVLAKWCILAILLLASSYFYKPRQISVSVTKALNSWRYWISAFLDSLGFCEKISPQATVATDPSEA